MRVTYQNKLHKPARLRTCGAWCLYSSPPFWAVAAAATVWQYKKKPQVHQGTSAVCGPHKNILLTTGNIRSLLRPFRLQVAPDTACGNPISGRKMEGDFAEGERPWRNVYRDEDFHLLYNMVCATLSLWKLLIHLKKKRKIIKIWADTTCSDPFHKCHLNEIPLKMESKVCLCEAAENRSETTCSTVRHYHREFVRFFLRLH